MKTAIGVFLILHGMAHLVGFIVPWKIAKMDDMPYSTRVLNGKLDVGHAGIRMIGIAWLAIAIAYGYVGYGILTNHIWWYEYAYMVTLVSLLFCIIQLKETKIGVFINLFILIAMPLARHFGWLWFAQV